MKNGKYQNGKSAFNVRPIAIMLAVALLIGASIGGTIAWLTAKTESVENTFTVGDVNITLKESKINVAENGTVTYDDPVENVTSQYPLIPGNTYKKDPVVAVVNSASGVVSEDCYLFVKFEESAKAQEYLDYTSTLTTANGWTQGEGTGEGKDGIPTNVWYREVKKTAAAEDKSWNLLAGNDEVEGLEDGCITINATAVTKDTMDIAAQQYLKYTAYAIQKANIANAATAWTQIQAAQNSGNNG